MSRLCHHECEARDAIDPKVFKEVLNVLDPKGEIQAWRQASAGLAALMPFLPEARQMQALSGEMQELLEVAALANQAFSPLGWGVASISVPVLRSALAALDQSVDSAEEILANAWTVRHVDRSIMRMKTIYARMEPDGVSEIRLGRWRLMQEAKRLHFESRFGASVPLILANIEGFVADAEEGRLFFTVRDSLKMQMHDSTRLTGMVCALATLHTLYTSPVGVTTAESVMSRHGIMHGRVLGYGTKVTSAKCLTLFDAVADLLI